MTDNVGGLFATLDEIDAVATVGTPPGFDLVSLLSDTFRTRQPWFDLAQVTSNVLYQYVEQQRIALGLSRDPRHLARVLKIATLKMMGIDWNSDSLTDDDYDRMVESVGLYNANHGTNDFVAYMGYSLGLPLTLFPLWTTDYLSFTPGPQSPAVYDSPPGPWYPTTHVGIAYDQYAPNASDADVQVLTDIFYRMAPIHLVLQWVGTLVSLGVTLYHSQNAYETSEDYAFVEYEPLVYLYAGDQAFEQSTDTAVCEPLYPNREIDQSLFCVGVETDIEGMPVTTSGFAWTEGMPLPTPMVLTGGYGVWGSNGPNVVISEPGSVWYSTATQGLLVQQSAVFLQSASSQPQMSNWMANNCTVLETFSLPEGLGGYTVTSTVNGGNIVGCIPVSGTDCITLQFRPNTTPMVTLARGVDTVTLTIAGMTIAATLGVSSSGVFELGTTGFYCLWAVMPGMQVSVYPGGISGIGGIDWLDCQIIQGAQYPMPVAPTPASPSAFSISNSGSAPTSNGVDFDGDFSSDYGDLAGDFNIDFNTDELNPGLYGPTGTFGSSFENTSFNVSWEGGDFDYYFLGGIISYDSLQNLQTASIPTSVMGTQIWVELIDLAHPYGIILFNAYSLHEEWALSGAETVLSILDGFGNGLLITASNAGLSLQVVGSGVAPIITSIPGKAFSLGIAWTPTGVKFYVGGVSHASGAILSAGLATAYLASTSTTNNGTWVLENFSYMRSNINGVLPTDSYMLAVTA